MKVNTKLIALMALLAAGSASAAGTVAGTDIKNTATANFSDPSDPTGNTPAKPVNSNEVVTKVLPKPIFDIYYKGDTTDGKNVVADGKSLGTVPTGTLVSSVYTAINTGNVQLKIDIAADTTGGGVAATYYPLAADGNSDSTLTQAEINAWKAADPTNNKPLTSVTLAPDGTQDFFQVFTATGAANDTVGASPEGTVAAVTATGGPLPVNGYTTTAQEENKTVDTDLQYVKVTIYKGAIETTPPTDPTNPDGDPSTPATPGNTVTPPPTTGPVGPSNPGSGTPADPTSPDDPITDTNVPSVPGYMSGNTPIAISGDVQNAYPPADGDTDLDKVTFNNVVTNGGGLADTVTLTLPTNLPEGVSAVFVGTDADDTKPGFQVVVPANGTATYKVEVTYPDSDTTTTPRTSYPVLITATSGNDPTQSATTTDTVYPPAMNFGDDNGATAGAIADQPTGSEKIQTVDPSKAADTSPIDSPNSLADSTAAFPMNIENTGAYNDSYLISATTTVPGATVKYYDASGAELPTTTIDGKTYYITPVVEKGKEITVYAVIDVPTGTTKGDYTVSQTATSNYSKITLTDTDDVIRVGSAGDFVMGKFVNPGTGTTANTIDVTKYPAPYNTGYGATGTAQQPGATLKYAIFGKNAFNGSVSNVVLTDPVPANTTYVTDSAKCAVYKADGTLNTAKTCTASLVGTTVTSAAVNLDLGESVSLSFDVTIN